MQLSDLLHDYEHYDAAAEALAPLCDAIEKNPDVARAYTNAQTELGSAGLRLARSRMRSPPGCITSGPATSSRNTTSSTSARSCSQAIKLDETDADVLIAMYRLEDADDAWMADTRKRIQKLGRKVEEEIADNPNNPIPYNQWAWLIANTEGDFPKAVRYSRRSLELAPEHGQLPRHAGPLLLFGRRTSKRQSTANARPSLSFRTCR